MTKKKKFIPSFVVQSDDLVIKDDEGNEHRPHEGEWVRFRKGVPLKVMRLVSQAAQVEDLDEDAPAEAWAEVAEGYARMADDLIEALARQILNWNWTDENYAPLPTPADREGFLDALASLEDYELSWLIEHLSDGAKLSKN